MYAQHVVMHPCMHNIQLTQPKDQMSPQGDLPSPHTFEKDFEVAREAIPLANKCKGQMGEPLPTCQGPWGMLHQISRLYTQVWQFPRAACRNRLEKVMPIAIP